MADLQSKTGATGGFGKQAPQSRTHSSGRIAETIGTGDNAKNSIVWMTITWSFCIASMLSLLFFALVVCYKDFNYIDNIKSVWSIFVPIITLALGYAFGKSQ
jgi:tellurite resistance protein TehA-like permease